MDKTIAYLDSSAIMKLIVDEEHSQELISSLSRYDCVTNEISLVEVHRALKRIGVTDNCQTKLEEEFEQIFLVGVDRLLLEDASSIPPTIMRSLDAIHLASARRIHSDLVAVVSYDKRLLFACQQHGLPFRSPGAVLS